MSDEIANDSKEHSQAGKILGDAIEKLRTVGWTDEARAAAAAARIARAQQQTRLEYAPTGSNQMYGVPSTEGMPLMMRDGAVKPDAVEAAFKGADENKTWVGNSVDRVTVRSVEGKQFTAGGQDFSEAAHFSPAGREITVFHANNQYPDYVKNELMPHELAHGVWHDESMVPSNLDAFKRATEEEGGVTDYSKSWLKETERPGGVRIVGPWQQKYGDAGYNENFAEMTAKIAHGRALGLDTSQTIYYERFPKTYKAWYGIMSARGWRGLPAPK